MLTNHIVEAEKPAAGDDSTARESATAPQVFAPREETGREGVLIVGQPPTPRPPAALRAIAADALIELVQQTTHWGEDRPALEERLGDHRSLILDFRRDDGLLLRVQIWSAPAHEATLLVGTDQPVDVLQGGFIKSARLALESRGFEIGSTATTFRKALPVPKAKEAPGIANEMLGLLTEVLGYDGTMALVYRMRQATVLDARHVMHGITRPALQTFLRVWGLEASAPSGESPTLVARSHGINFFMELYVPSESSPDVYWEVHCFASFSIPRGRIAALLEEVNGKSWLVKACERPSTDKDTGWVRFSYGFNLAGGVTPNHLKGQLFEWLENVRRLWSEWGRPVPPPQVEADHSAAATVH
jgi:hypothetical protein